MHPDAWIESDLTINGSFSNLSSISNHVNNGSYHFKLSYPDRSIEWNQSMSPLDSRGDDSSWEFALIFADNVEAQFANMFEGLSLANTSQTGTPMALLDGQKSVNSWYFSVGQRAPYNRTKLVGAGRTAADFVELWAYSCSDPEI